MTRISLQFQGVESQPLLVTLLASVALILAGYGAWMLFRRQWHRGALCLAIVGAIAAAALLMRTAGITGAGAWMGLLAVEILLAVAAFYSAVYAYLGRGRMATLLILRTLGILALLMLLFKPALSFMQVGADDRSSLPILLDRSGSMATADQADLPDRYVRAVQALSLQRPRLDEHFRPVWYHFAESLSVAETLDSLSELAPAGPGTAGTDIALAIRGAAADYSAANLAGIVVLSDGIQTASDASTVVSAARDAGTSVYAVAVGSDSESLAGRRNIELLSADCPFEAVKNNVTTITCRVKLTGLAAAPAEVRLLPAEGDQPLDAARLWTDKNVDTLTAELKWTPRDPPAPVEGADVRRLRIVIPANPAETVTEDNALDLHVLVTEPRVRVLYVEGSMRPEFKFLRRLLDSDPNVQFMGLVRITENRFLAQGSIEGVQLRGLPETDEEFRLFDVMVLGDLDATFLTPAQMTRLRQFVNDGGGLLMLGGHNSFGPGGYGGTELEQVLPVVVGPRSEPQETTPLLPQLTAAGQQHPIFEGLSGYFYGPEGQQPDQKLSRLSDLLGCVTVVSAKPGAEVLAVHPTRGNESGPLVVLAVQLYGAGRSAAFTPDTTWQWYLPLRAMGAESPYERFWGQFTRWLAGSESKNRKAASSLVARLDPQYVLTGQPSRISARVRDDKGRTPPAAVVSCTVTPADEPAKAETIPLSLVPGAGLFQTEFRPQGEGRYELSLVAADAQGAPLGRDQLTLLGGPHSAETDRLARNDELLRELAKVADGRFTDLAGLPDLVDQIVARQRERTGPPPDAVIRKLYNFTLLFVAFAALITGEWLLRRSWQLH